jgi:hypothetical protein
MFIPFGLCQLGGWVLDKERTDNDKDKTAHLRYPIILRWVWAPDLLNFDSVYGFCALLSEQG